MKTLLCALLALVATGAAAQGAAAGKAVYDSTCAVCHAAGIVGAPKPGDAAAWAPRVKGGLDALVRSAIKGTTTGMPPRGGRPDLSDAQLRAAIDRSVRHRVGFCADTCHLYAAGYDLVRDFEGVWRNWDATCGRAHLRCLHLNDSKTPLGSRRDRHELIGEGTLGAAPFRRIMREPRFANVIKILETPKGDDEFTQDRRMLRRLRAYARGRPAR